MRRLLLLLLVACSVGAARGMSYVPPISDICIAGDRIIFVTNLDVQEVVCISRARGTKLWQQAYPEGVRLHEHNGGVLLVTEGNIYKVNPRNGSKARAFKSGGHSLSLFACGPDFALAAGENFLTDEWHATLLDSRWKPRWRLQMQVHNAKRVGSTILCEVVEGDIDQRYYTALDFASGQEKWRRKVENWPECSHLVLSNALVVATGKTMRSFDLESGALLRSAELSGLPEWSQLDDGNGEILVAIQTDSHPDSLSASIYSYEFPSLKFNKKLREFRGWVGQSQVYENILVNNSAFDLTTGRELWVAPVGTNPIRDGFIYYVEDEAESPYLKVIEVKTGVTRTLYTGKRWVPPGIRD